MTVHLQVKGKQKAKALQSDGMSAACRRGSHGSCAVLRCQCSCHAAVLKQPITRCHAEDPYHS